MFKLPVVNDESAPSPTAVLPPPVTVLGAPWPTAVVVFAGHARVASERATKVLSVPRSCAGSGSPQGE
jgi:hypothetical protein